MVAAINLAVPDLAASSLAPTPTQTLWIVDAYVVVFGSLLIPLGAVGDRFGRKGSVVAGLSIYAAGCVLATAAPTTATLIAGRALSGVGAALALPGTLSVIVHVFPRPERPGAIAAWSIATGLGGFGGNIVGGVILQWLSWRWMFGAMVPLALFCAWRVARVIPRVERHEVALDPLGSTALVLALVAVLYAIIEGPELGWGAASVVGSLLLGATMFTALVLFELRRADPLLDPRIFRIAPIRAGVTGIITCFVGLFATFYTSAQYLQYAKGYAPLVAGLILVPVAIAVFLSARVGMRLRRRVSVRGLVGAGMASLVVGLLLVSTSGTATSPVVYLATLMFVCAGMGLATPQLSAVLVASLPARRAGMGSGLNSASREIGCALGVAVLGTIVNSRLAASVPSALRGRLGSDDVLEASSAFGATLHNHVVDSFVDATNFGYRILAVPVTIVGCLVVLWLHREGAHPSAPAPAPVADRSAEVVRNPL
jgi:MFS family permease